LIGIIAHWYLDGNLMGYRCKKMLKVNY